MNFSNLRNYAVKHRGISSNIFDKYSKIINIFKPTIIEEHQLNVATMDVFSINDEHYLLGVPIDDYGKYYSSTIIVSRFS